VQITFEGRKVVVTGASRGIGRAIADAFAADGADVAVCARGAEGLKATAAGLARHGRRVHAAACDIGDGPALTAFIEGAAEALGGIDVLVNNASGMGLADDEAAWAAGINVDILAAVRASRAAVPFMEKAGGGAIVNISSISGLLATRRSIPYNAVKAALINLTASQGLVLAEKGIRANAIAPGSIDFPGSLWDERRKAKSPLYAETLATIPSGRFGTPEEIASVALFLASDKAGWITGQTIVVDGGQILS
jgi:3-oxoacyl-[acyl-carrier protein] reductase